MQFNTVIFDMDGLLIDSEPLWGEAASEVFHHYGLKLSPQQYNITTGLRTKEFVQWWFSYYNVPETEMETACEAIIQKVTDKILQKGKPMSGLSHILNFFISRRYKIGLATSSPASMVDVVLNYLGIKNYIQAVSSAEDMLYGKPHPQVYLDCAEQLHSSPFECICFEDSFNGMIAAKAARMKCVIVPAPHQHQEKRWDAADLKISSLQNFNELLLNTL